jgi:hypothetical protein
MRGPTARASVSTRIAPRVSLGPPPGWRLKRPYGTIS